MKQITLETRLTSSLVPAKLQVWPFGRTLAAHLEGPERQDVVHFVLSHEHLFDATAVAVAIEIKKSGGTLTVSEALDSIEVTPEP